MCFVRGASTVYQHFGLAYCQRFPPCSSHVSVMIDLKTMSAQLLVLKRDNWNALSSWIHLNPPSDCRVEWKFNYEIDLLFRLKHFTSINFYDDFFHAQVHKVVADIVKTTNYRQDSSKWLWWSKQTIMTPLITRIRKQKPSHSSEGNAPFFSSSAHKTLETTIKK